MSGRVRRGGTEAYRRIPGLPATGAARAGHRCGAPHPWPWDIRTGDGSGQRAVLGGRVRALAERVTPTLIGRRAEPLPGRIADRKPSYQTFGQPFRG
ncbi:hypothetical protein GCM10010272_04990 [Streptomyces lateritius]|nr:hypothetical protein GCM10010272_04990 [Streptomyces lateritius]